MYIFKAFNDIKSLFPFMSMEFILVVSFSIACFVGTFSYLKLEELSEKLSIFINKYENYE